MKKSFAIQKGLPVTWILGRGDVVKDDRGSKDAAASLCFLIPIPS